MKPAPLATKINNNRRWLYAIPTLARKFVGLNIEEILQDGFDYFTSPINREVSDEIMAEDLMVQKFADHFQMDINQVTNKLIERLPRTIEVIGKNLAAELALYPDERETEKLRKASKLLGGLAKTKFRNDPVRSKILKSAARIAGICADDIQFGR